MSQHHHDALKRVNFFVIGAAKCGTTTLYARLNGHPEVYLSPLKEPNYHSREDLDPSRFSKAFKANTKLDLTDYLAAPDPLPEMQVGFVREERDYARLFAGANDTHRIVGECSTSYLWSPSAPAALKAAHPDAKIVVSLRDPIARIFSHYLMARKYGFVKGSVVEAVKADLAHRIRRGAAANSLWSSACTTPKSPAGGPISPTTSSWCSSPVPCDGTRRGTTCKRGWG